MRLPDATHDRLRALAGRSGRSAAFHIREAVERYLEDIEDLHAAGEAAAEHRKSGSRTIPPDELDGHPGPEN